MLYIALFILFCGFSLGEQIAEFENKDQRIVGGADAPIGFAPHMVALVIITGHFPRIFCGGSIISARHVLTAAHCVDSVVEDGSLTRSLYGVVGSNKWNSTRNTIKFYGYSNHPKWDSEVIKYDVGVLVMSEELAFSDTISVIELEFDWIKGGEDSYVTGWGMMGPKLEDDVLHLAPTPNELQILHVKTIAADECVTSMAKLATQDGRIPPVDPAVEICTFHSVSHGMCNGDSGSALVSEASGRQIGVVSWGVDCAVGAPDVFARISGVKNFLFGFLQGRTSRRSRWNYK